MEVEADMGNLLAQGYVPMATRDGWWFWFLPTGISEADLVSSSRAFSSSYWNRNCLPQMGSTVRLCE